MREACECHYEDLWQCDVELVAGSLQVFICVRTVERDCVGFNSGSP